MGVESQLTELETSHKELTDHKYRSQAAIRELKAKLKATEEVNILLHTLNVHVYLYICVSVSIGVSEIAE